ncbi:hypothetical protein B0H66DRAFT_629688 [Apodospora peruviana]|uniref:Uncharacterized protein n=1 Tax=Apodospora peruviana TaxID=516989 RepID=A0AAE0HW57_9PEZI|nr:hypothetical protein B0H66DRAFT_629688 [Apodospora peruviana]
MDNRYHIPAECYLADEPQVFLLLLHDYVRPNTEICTGCKRRCLECLVKGASDEEAYWTTIPPYGKRKQPELRLDARLNNMGINADTQYGLTLDDAKFKTLFEPVSRQLLFSEYHAQVLIHAAARVTSFAAGKAWEAYSNDEQRRDSAGEVPRPYGIGDKLWYMVRGRFTIGNLTTGRHMGAFVVDLSRFLSCYGDPGRPWKADDDCTCSYKKILSGLIAAEYSALGWPNKVFVFVRERVDGRILARWEEFAPPTEPMTAIAALLLSAKYDATESIEWQDKWGDDNQPATVDERTGDIAPPEDTEMAHNLREDAVQLVLQETKFNYTWELAVSVDHFIRLHFEGVELLLRRRTESDEAQAVFVKTYDPTGGLYTGITIPTFVAARTFVMPLALIPTNDVGEPADNNPLNNPSWWVRRH